MGDMVCCGVMAYRQWKRVSLVLVSGGSERNFPMAGFPRSFDARRYFLAILRVWYFQRFERGLCYVWRRWDIRVCFG